jgi:PII-like signaling protein
MNTPALLRIHVGETDRCDHQPLYEAIVLKARERKLAGATVFRSPLGFGASSHVHTAKILQLSTDLPMIVEIVDEEEKLRAFWAEIAPLMDGGLATLQRVEVLAYAPGNGAS